MQTGLRGGVAAFATVVVFALVAPAAAPPAGAAAPPVRVAFAGDAPDPFVLTAGGRHYLYSTNVFPFGFTVNVPVRVSDDLRSWQYLGDALPQLGGWAGSGFTWAPAILAVGGGYVLYYTATHAASGRQCIGAARATSPAGPFAPGASPLVCPVAAGGAIDPDPYRAPDGRLYLHWKIDGNAIGGTVSIQGRELTADGMAFTGSTSTLLWAANGWERGIVENPAMVHEGGTTWLLYSGGDWESAGYAVGAARCQGPLGPCTRAASSPWLTRTAGPAGTGGASVFRDRAGRLRVAFHGWPGVVGYRAGGERWAYIEPVDIGAGGPSLRTDLPAAAADPAAWLPFADPSAFVARQYLDLLGRQPDPGGLAAWTALLRDGLGDGPGVVTGFFQSSEYGGMVEPLARLYFSAFGRLPDAGGLFAWLGARRAGMPLSAVADGFAGSSEFRARYGDGTDEAYVTALYENTLGRAPDPQGLAAWTAALAGGMTRAQALLGFSESSEHKRLAASEVRVVGAYLGLLRRDPDPDGWAHWVGYLDAGHGLRSFLTSILRSSEYARRIAALA